ncbi:conserved hypothetical protein [Burkholderia cenocepacia HI2424]|uniref:Uncharacterized protein n=2 Tax=Burkholderia cepacia complex TaxID=87882 RepID=A0A427NS89_9BURK|nr:conserved hypothetical protein [Burkholderia cenocepacia HI2424]PNO74993.1 hypothetical protein DK10_010265 [Burkholderia cenocepacia]RSC10374.1 hypothetical protein EGT41_18145 [Burkholderia cenocepacia]
MLEGSLSGGWSEDGEAAKPGFAPLRELPAAGAFTVDPVWLLLHANFGLFRYCSHSISATAAHVGETEPSAHSRLLREQKNDRFDHIRVFIDCYRHETG